MAGPEGGMNVLEKSKIPAHTWLYNQLSAKWPTIDANIIQVYIQ